MGLPGRKDSTETGRRDSWKKDGLGGAKKVQATAAKTRPNQGKKQKSPWMCKTCGNAFEENQKVTECFKCKEWFHKECTALKEVEYEILENSNDSKQWLWRSC